MFTAQDYMPSYNSVLFSSSGCCAKSGSVDAKLVLRKSDNIV